MIYLEAIRKTYRGPGFEVPALRGIDLSISLDSFVAVVGKSGSGKSSLLKILGLLDLDYSGVYRFNGTDYRRLRSNDGLDDVMAAGCPTGTWDARLSAGRRRIGYVFQDFQLVERYTISQNVKMAAVVRRGAINQSDVANLLDRVGLANKADRYPGELSGGQKQRAAIARALIGHPDLILADEPTGSLDGRTARDVVGLMCDLRREVGCGLVLVTHDMDVAAKAERMIELVDGVVGHDLLH